MNESNCVTCGGYLPMWRIDQCYACSRASYLSRGGTDYPSEERCMKERFLNHGERLLTKERSDEPTTG
jgi:hypothetical protein